MSGLPSSATGGSTAEDGNLRSVPLLFQALAPGSAREAAVALLAGAGYDGDLVRTWCEAGTVYALVDVAARVGAPPPAAAVVVRHGEADMELALLVAPGPDSPDLSRRLLAHLSDALRRSEVPRLVAATTNADFPMMALLQEAGFRIAAVERDGCPPERQVSPAGVGGIPARDIVWFEQGL